MNIRRIFTWIMNSDLARGNRGGIAISMLLVMVVMAVPLTTSALKVSGQLNRASRVYNDRLSGYYNAGGAIDVAIHDIINDPDFDNGLTPSNPDKAIVADVNGEDVNVTVTKIFGNEDLQGQGLIMTKAVTPTTAPVGILTTFTYTITIENKGTDTVTLKEVEDFQPPGFTYVENSTTGITTDNPTTGDTSSDDCGQNSTSIVWDLVPDVQITAQQELTLTFQSNATLPNGTYYNQAKITYDPWWVSPDVEIYTPYTVPITVGTGTPNCGYAVGVVTTKDASPQEAPPGPTTFTYTVSLENWDSSTRYLCTITDLLPPYPFLHTRLQQRHHHRRAHRNLGQQSGTVGA